MKRSYDLIAPFYDRLATLVYGNALRDAQMLYLSHIPPASAVLIAGGGTGRILEDIAHIHPQGLYIDYIDISVKMIEKAMSRNAGNNEVHFINQSVLGWQAEIDYDVIITPFFFDNFSEDYMRDVFSLLHSSLRSNGLWLYTDFQTGHQKPYWQKALLSVMYSFFRMFAGVEAKQLPDVVSQFRIHHYDLVKQKTFFHQFINASLYKKLIPGG